MYAINGNLQGRSHPTLFARRVAHQRILGGADGTIFSRTPPKLLTVTGYI